MCELILIALRSISIIKRNDFDIFKIELVALFSKMTDDLTENRKFISLNCKWYTNLLLIVFLQFSEIVH